MGCGSGMGLSSRLVWGVRGRKRERCKNLLFSGVYTIPIYSVDLLFQGHMLGGAAGTLIGNDVGWEIGDEVSWGLIEGCEGRGTFHRGECVMCRYC